MSETVVTINLGEGTSQVTTLHVHVEANDELLESIMASVDDLEVKAADVVALTATTLSTVTETAKDVKRLLAAGDTTAAAALLDTAITSLTEVNAKLAEVDSTVEAASPEPTPEPEPTPTPEGSVEDLLK